MAQTLATLRLEAQQRANQESKTLVATAEWNRYIDQAMAELYDIVIAANPHYYVRSQAFTLAALNTFDLTTLAGVFYKLRGVDYLPSATGRPITLHPFNFAERNRQGYRAYALEGTNLLIMPSTNFAGNYTAWYTPKPPYLSADFTVDYATTGPLPACTASGGPGPGKLLTANVNGTLTVDGTVSATLKKILVKDQANPIDNGVYIQSLNGSGAGPWQLIRQLDTNALITGSPNIAVSAGVTNVGQQFMLTSTNVNVDVLPLAYGPQVLDTILDVWAEFITVTAALAATMKEESPIDALAAVKSLIIERINKAAPNRDGEPAQAADLMSAGYATDMDLWY